MEPILARKGEALTDIFRKLAEGDPVAITIVVVGVVVTVAIVWLATSFMKWKGQKLADGIGQCDYTFSPEGLFGKRVFVISGEKDSLPFTVEAKKIRKGDYRTFLRIQKPKGVTWQELQANLHESRDGVASATRVDETPDSITLEYFGVGGDPKYIRVFLAEISAGARSRGTESTGVPSVSP